MSALTVFLSAATVDLRGLRELLSKAFRAAQFRVLVQEDSLGAATGNVRQLLTGAIAQSDCVIHLAGTGYGSDAADPFPDSPDFRCSWTQFEYYHAHASGIPVYAFVCAPELSQFEREEDETLAALQQAHRERVASGQFTGTPLAAGGSRTLNAPEARTRDDLLIRVAETVGTLQRKHAAFANAGRQLRELAGPSLHQIPPPPSDFTGREADLAVLRALDPGDGALITGLRGMGGIGKTVLAYAIAHEWRGRFPDAQLLLDGRGTSEDTPPPPGPISSPANALSSSWTTPPAPTRSRRWRRPMVAG